MSASHRYALEIYREDGTMIGQTPITVDFEAARECALFAGLRRNRVPLHESEARASVLPLWHDELGRPYVKGFRVSFPGEGRDETFSDFTTDYFRPVARAKSVALVKEGVLTKGERFRFRPLAFPGTGAESARPPALYRSRDVSPPLAVKETPLEELFARSQPHGAPDADDHPVFVPSRVLDEMRSVSRGAGALETGGILVGHLHRDARRPEIFLEVTAQLPARHVISETSRLTFTPRTWTAAQAALDLRRRDEQWLGWWHRHPVAEWCKECAPGSQRICRFAGDFFSEHDRQLHRTVFSRAYTVALVLNDVAFSDPTFSLFGWREGRIEPRGFHVLAEPRATPALQGGEHAA